jgi:hypothetical protein
LTTTRNPGLPICQHIALGTQLQQVRAQLMDALTAVQAGYPKTSKAVRQAQKALRELDGLRSELDSVSAGENPGDGDWSTTAYYGADREAWERETLPVLRRHQASNPACCTGKAEAPR